MPTCSAPTRGSLSQVQNLPAVEYPCSNTPTWQPSRPKRFQGNRTAAVETLIRNGPNVKYVPNNAYADAKLVVAWWTAALARRLPFGMAVYAVSPGSSTATNVVRSAGWRVEAYLYPIVNLIPA